MIALSVRSSSTVSPSSSERCRVPRLTGFSRFPRHETFTRTVNNIELIKLCKSDVVHAAEVNPSLPCSFVERIFVASAEMHTSERDDTFRLAVLEVEMSVGMELETGLED